MKVSVNCMLRIQIPTELVKKWIWTNFLAANLIHFKLESFTILVITTKLSATF